MTGNRSNIKVAKPVHQRLKAQKRGGESFNELIDKMIDQYDPEEVHP